MDYLTIKDWLELKNFICLLYKPIHVFTREQPQFFDDVIVRFFHHIEVKYVGFEVQDVLACVSEIPGDSFKRRYGFWGWIIKYNNLFMPDYDAHYRYMEEEKQIRALICSFRALMVINDSEASHDRGFVQLMNLYQLREEMILLYQDVVTIVKLKAGRTVDDCSDMIRSVEEKTCRLLEQIQANKRRYPSDAIKKAAEQLGQTVHYYRYLNQRRKVGELGIKLSSKKTYSFLAPPALIPCLPSIQHDPHKTDEEKARSTIEDLHDNFAKVHGSLRVRQKQILLQGLTVERLRLLKDCLAELYNDFEMFCNDCFLYFDAAIMGIMDNKVAERVLEGRFLELFSQEESGRWCYIVKKAGLNFIDQKNMVGEETKDYRIEMERVLLQLCACNFEIGAINEKVAQLYALFLICLCWGEVYRYADAVIAAFGKTDDASKNTIHGFFISLRRLVESLEDYDNNLPTSELIYSASLLRNTIYYYLYKNAEEIFKQESLVSSAQEIIREANIHGSEKEKRLGGSDDEHTETLLKRITLSFLQVSGKVKERKSKEKDLAEKFNFFNAITKSSQVRPQSSPSVLPSPAQREGPGSFAKQLDDLARISSQDTAAVTNTTLSPYMLLRGRHRSRSFLPDSTMGVGGFTEKKDLDAIIEEQYGEQSPLKAPDLIIVEAGLYRGGSAPPRVDGGVKGNRRRLSMQLLSPLFRNHNRDGKKCEDGSEQKNTLSIPETPVSVEVRF